MLQFSPENRLDIDSIIMHQWTLGLTDKSSEISGNQCFVLEEVWGELVTSKNSEWQFCIDLVGKEISVGRSMNVVIMHPRVSGFSFIINVPISSIKKGSKEPNNLPKPDSKEIAILSRKSKYPIWINEKVVEIDTSCVLSDGDLITLVKPSPHNKSTLSFYFNTKPNPQKSWVLKPTFTNNLIDVSSNNSPNKKTKFNAYKNRLSQTDYPSWINNQPEIIIPAVENINSYKFNNTLKQKKSNSETDTICDFNLINESEIKEDITKNDEDILSSRKNSETSNKPWLYLKLIEDGRFSKSWSISDGVCILGRSKESNVVLPESCISYIHCNIVKGAGNDHIYIIDYSHNGTWVNEKRLVSNTKYKINPNDLIVFEFHKDFYKSGDDIYIHGGFNKIEIKHVKLGFQIHPML
ncbi:hypothetical protein BB559_005328 [Furculomyces boomerangus]|uniref:FHA domain-containing protein n=1 Tax=Furculomyces boomerangus TaxID=61424 RepID=A0A2T9Y9D2_9FUNG|nr:hypothetical protein BB559_005328 [Furculomyces boomerangus]